MAGLTEYAKNQIDSHPIRGSSPKKISISALWKTVAIRRRTDLARGK
jgi:hypothetical protein